MKIDEDSTPEHVMIVALADIPSFLKRTKDPMYVFNYWANRYNYAVMRQRTRR